MLRRRARPSQSPRCAGAPCSAAVPCSTSSPPSRAWCGAVQPFSKPGRPGGAGVELFYSAAKFAVGGYDENLPMSVRLSSRRDHIDDRVVTRVGGMNHTQSRLITWRHTFASSSFKHDRDVVRLANPLPQRFDQPRGRPRPVPPPPIRTRANHIRRINHQQRQPRHPQPTSTAITTPPPLLHPRPPASHHHSTATRRRSDRPFHTPPAILSTPLRLVRAHAAAAPPGLDRADV